jgi:hypothetical protein
MTTTRSILQIVLRRGIWRVWLDGKVFGDYRSKSQALEAAQAAQRAMAGVGRIAEVVLNSETGGLIYIGTWSRRRATDVEHKAHQWRVERS